MHSTHVISRVITVQGLYPHGHLLGQRWSCAQAGKLRLNEVKMLPPLRETVAGAAREPRPSLQRLEISLI